MEKHSEGYMRALKDMDTVMTDSIIRNGGAVDALQILSVFNDMANFLHNAMLDAKLANRIQ